MGCVGDGDGCSTQLGFNLRTFPKIHCVCVLRDVTYKKAVVICIFVVTWERDSLLSEFSISLTSASPLFKFENNLRDRRLGRYNKVERGWSKAGLQRMIEICTWPV
jgi:hypothetical protein